MAVLQKTDNQVSSGGTLYLIRGLKEGYCQSLDIVGAKSRIELLNVIGDPAQTDLINPALGGFIKGDGIRHHLFS